MSSSLRNSLPNPQTINPGNIIRGTNAIIRAYGFSTDNMIHEAIQAQIKIAATTWFKSLPFEMQLQIQSKAFPKPLTSSVRVQFGTDLAQSIMKVIVYGLPATPEDKKVLSDAGVSF